jgi:hypothetical protein
VNQVETRAILIMLAAAHDRDIPDGLEVVWSATLGDLPFELVKTAALELIKTSPYLPKVSEVRDRARLIRAERQRGEQRRLQLEGRLTAPVNHNRTGAAMCSHVLGRLADAGQDPRNDKFLGRERAVDIAEEAAREWLDKTSEPAR